MVILLLFILDSEVDTAEELLDLFEGEIHNIADIEHQGETVAFEVNGQAAVQTNYSGTLTNEDAAVELFLAAIISDDQDTIALAIASQDEADEFRSQYTGIVNTIELSEPVARESNEALYAVAEYDPERNPSEDVAAALEMTALSGKRVLLIVGGNWCPDCRVLETFISDNETIEAGFERDFLIVKVNISEENLNESFLAQYPDYEWVPHFFILNTDGSLAHSLDTRELMTDGLFDEIKLLDFLDEWQPVVPEHALLYFVDEYNPDRNPFDDVTDAAVEASAQGKRILLIVGGEWCVWCHILEDYIDGNPAVAGTLLDGFVVVKVNFSEENENADFFAQYSKVPAYPHFFVLDSQGNLLHSQPTDVLEAGDSYDNEKNVGISENPVASMIGAIFDSNQSIEQARREKKMKKGIIIILGLILLGRFGLTEFAAASDAHRGAITQSVAAAVTPTPTSDSLQSGPQPGAEGIGDPYFPELGNGGYDVDHYDLELAVDMDSGNLTGTMSMIALANQELSSFNLDFQGFEVDAVTVNDAPVDYTRTEHELTVIPVESLPAETEFTVTVSYNGVPEPVEPYTELPFPLGWTQEADTIYVIGEPNGAAGWFPVNDHPRDKATYTFWVTVPRPFVVAANGLLQETIESEETTTFVWAAADPMASYLATLVIGNFLVEEDIATWIPTEPVAGSMEETDATAPAAPETNSDKAADATTVDETEEAQAEPVSLPIQIYYPADWTMENMTAMTDTAEMVAYFSDLFGPYPFETYGVAAIDADETHILNGQTLPIVSGAGITGDYFAGQDAAEALAHQWFGNSVSPDTWQDVWLSEGFATYAGWLWVEHVDGVDTRDALIRERYRALTVDQPLAMLAEQGLPVTDEAFAQVLAESYPPPGSPLPENLFNGSVTDRGALTLHALRQRLGDELFFNILQTYAEQFKYGTAGTADFTMLAEELSGESLADFFDAWLYGAEAPDLPELELYNKVEGTVKIPSLRIRGGPGTAFGALGSAVQDETVHVLGQAYDCQWLQIRTSAGILGWMSGSSEYIALSRSCDDLAEAEIPLTPAPPPPAAAAPAETVSTAVQHFDQGLSYFQEEQWDQAIAEFQAAIRLEPTFSQAYQGLGYGYAFGPNDFANAIEALETYLKLEPDAEDRAGVEQDIQLMKDELASRDDTLFDIPPGMALFVFKNYSGEDWNVDIGPYSMHVPANPPDREYSYTTLPIEPGTYIWKAHTAGGGFYITDQHNNKAFEITVAPGEIVGTQCCR